MSWHSKSSRHFFEIKLCWAVFIMISCGRLWIFSRAMRSVMWLAERLFNNRHTCCLHIRESKCGRLIKAWHTTLHLAFIIQISSEGAMCVFSSLRRARPGNYRGWWWGGRGSNVTGEENSNTFIRLVFNGEIFPGKTVLCGKPRHIGNQSKCGWWLINLCFTKS